MTDFNHFDESGNAMMVDVSAKPVSQRSATAMATIKMATNTISMIRQGDIKKGDVLGVANLAGVMGAKRTSELIPLCHILPLDTVQLKFEFDDELQSIHITSTCKVDGKTGVEMEALTGAAIAALTIYDMTKALSRNIVIRDVRLMEKTGGKQDFHRDN